MVSLNSGGNLKLSDGHDFTEVPLTSGDTFMSDVSDISFSQSPKMSSRGNNMQNTRTAHEYSDIPLMRRRVLLGESSALRSGRENSPSTSEISWSAWLKTQVYDRQVEYPILPFSLLSP